jgi:Gas vesicle protein K/Gas vesicle protein
MRSQTNKTRNQIIKKHHVTLAELLDRLLDKGVMVRGELMLAVADIDLVYLNLGLLLSSVKTVEEAARRGDHGEVKALSRQTSARGEFLGELQQEAEKEDVTAPPPSPQTNSQSGNNNENPITTLTSAIDSAKNQYIEQKNNVKQKANVDPKVDPKQKNNVEQKANIDPKNVEKGLAKLVLTLVDLIRNLMEKQAIRRIEAGQLNDKEIEDVGNTFFLLNEKMAELKQIFDLTDEDLNLDLGPLGELL